jgi:hypothetical protein
MFRKRLPALFLTLICQLSGLFLYAQDAALQTIPSQSIASQYPNSEDGFRRFLSDCVNTAKIGTQAQLNSAIVATDIPNYDQWFLSTYPGPGKSWIEPYAKGLNNNHILLKNMITYIAQHDGELVVRKVIDNPQGDRGKEWGMLHGEALPVDIYNARWKQLNENPTEKHDFLIGYFFYIDGGFRWDSGIREISGPEYRVDPIYPYPSDGKHPSGKVMLKFKILMDGSVSKNDITVYASSGFSQDPWLVDAAKKAVAQWLYWPPNLFDGSNEVYKVAMIDVIPHKH